jgi:lipid-A-disaccharide synthase-like uncharacterized protein
MNDWLIYAVGFFAQLLFSGRTLHQWLTSEKKKKVVTPSLFWKLGLLAAFIFKTRFCYNPRTVFYVLHLCKKPTDSKSLG